MRKIPPGGGEGNRAFTCCHGAYAIQAAIAALHAKASTREATDWRQIAALYAVLARVAPWPVVGLNRAVAIAMAEGPEAALPLLKPRARGTLR